MKSNRGFFIAITAIIIGGIVIMIGFGQGWFDGKPHRAPNQLTEKDESKEPVPPKGNRDLAKALGVDEDGMVEIGGVLRPKRDVELDKDKAEDPKILQGDWQHPGTAPTLKGDENPQVAGLFAELNKAEPPKAAQSLLFAPEPFDLENYEKNPSAYLGEIRPARVFQSAEPSADAPPIEPVGSTLANVIQGEKVVLKVKVKPKMPVTFHAQELGEFENRLKTISVAANEKGIAQASYHAVSGTLGIVNILAASPVHAEDVHFMVDVALPKK